MKKKFCLMLLAFAPMVLVATFGCNKYDGPPQQKAPAASSSGETVRGEVTYHGKKVNYGVVMFFDPTRAMDRKSGKAVPVAAAEIHEGNFETNKVPAGAVRIVLATDPDVDVSKALRPERPGAPLKKDGPIGAKKTDPPGPPDKGGKDGPPRPELPDLDKMPKIINPRTAKMSDEEKNMLRELNAKYGSYASSPINYMVTPGEQKLEIKLKKDEYDLVPTRAN